MTQRATLRALDADIMSAFRGAGMADTGTHRTVDGVETPDVTVTIDDVDVERYDGEGGVVVVGRRQELTLQRAEVDAPAEHDTVTLEDGDVYRLQQLVSRDASLTRWVAVQMRSEGL